MRFRITIKWKWKTPYLINCEIFNAKESGRGFRPNHSEFIHMSCTFWKRSKIFESYYPKYTHFSCPVLDGILFCRLPIHQIRCYHNIWLHESRLSLLIAQDMTALLMLHWFAWDWNWLLVWYAEHDRWTAKTVWRQAISSIVRHCMTLQLNICRRPLLLEREFLHEYPDSIRTLGIAVSLHFCENIHIPHEGSSQGKTLWTLKKSGCSWMNF